MELVLIAATFGMTAAILYRVLKVEKLAEKRKDKTANDVTDDGYAERGN